MEMVTLRDYYNDNDPDGTYGNERFFKVEIKLDGDFWYHNYDRNNPLPDNFLDGKRVIKVYWARGFHGSIFEVE